MVFKTFQNKGDFDSKDLKQACFPSLISNNDAFVERMILQPYEIKYNPNESFEIISSDREYDGVFGYILITNDQIPNCEGQYHPHCIYFMEIDERLIDLEWLAQTFQNIFKFIIKFNSQNDKEDIVWMTYGNEIYSKVMYKDDENYLALSHYFANVLLMPQ